MDENKLLNEIRQSAENVDAPESLHPDEIKNLLIRTPANNKKKTYRKWIPSAAIIALAAIGAYAGYSHFSSASDNVAVQTPENQGAESDAPASADSVFGVDSYELVYDTLKDMEQSEQKFRLFESSTGMEPATAEEADYALSDSSGSVSSNFSNTNIQETGVDEADIMKTDGDYIYILRGQTSIDIISADGADSECIASIQPDDYSDSFQEFYVDGDTLSVIANSSDTTMISEDNYYYEAVTDEFTTISTYDISDREHPVLTGSVKQNGSYGSSRKVGNIIYLFTQYYPDTSDKKSPKQYIPMINDNLISTEDICIPEHADSQNYLVISSVDVKNPDQTIDEKTILSAGSNYYVSQNNIYVYQEDWSNAETRTVFMKFHYEDGSISYENIAALKGYVKDRFSMNEYQGYLRVVMTSGNDTNALYILDENLKATGTIQDIARGETIQSARFLGNTGYFVTYKNMDPLFSVDLSDPENPKLLGSLKVTGFSSYLHFYSDDLLLGIGEETDPDTGEYYGIKLSMFDISDPANVTEISKYVIKDSYDCPATYSSKALLIDTAKNIFGFAVDEKYMIFSYDAEEGFVNKFTYKGTDPYTDENYGPSYGSYYNRSCFADDILYLSFGNTLHIYDMNDGYRELNSISLN